MTGNPQRVAIIELNRFHDEIIFPQVKALEKSGFDYALIVNEKIVRSGLIQPCDNVFVIKQRKGICKLVMVFQALSFLRNDDIIVLNSADWDLSRALLFFIRKKRPIAIVHNAVRLFDSKYQCLLTYAKRLIVLNDYIANELKEHGITVSSYYSVLRKEWFPEAYTTENEKYRIVSIPGVVSLEKRDYHSVIDWVEKDQARLRGKVKIEFLGNMDSPDGKVLHENICSKKLDDLFIIHNGFIPYKTFLQRVAKADYLLPLCKKEKYSTYKISAVYNYATGFDKLLLLDSETTGENSIYCRKIIYASLDDLTEILLDDKSDHIIDSRINQDNDYEYIRLIQ